MRGKLDSIPEPSTEGRYRAKGFVTLSDDGCGRPRPPTKSCPGRGRCVPDRHGLGSVNLQRSAAGEAALRVACVLDRGRGRQQALGRAGRLEPLHRPLSPARRLRRVLGAPVAPPPLLMPGRAAELAQGSAVQAPDGGRLVATALDLDVEHLALAVHTACWMMDGAKRWPR